MKSLTSKQLDLYIMNGSPDDFADLCWQAVAQLMIEDEEAMLAIMHYREEFEKAGIE